MTNDRLLFKTIAQIMDFDFNSIEDDFVKLKQIQDFQNTFGVIHGRVDGKISKIMQKSSIFQNLDNFDTEEDYIFLFLYPENETNRLRSKLFSLLSIFDEKFDINDTIFDAANPDILENMIYEIKQNGGYIPLKQYTEDENEFEHFRKTQPKINLATKYSVVDPDSTRRSRRQNNQLKFTIPVVNAGATSTILEDILTGLFSLIECSTNLLSTLNGLYSVKSILFLFFLFKSIWSSIIHTNSRLE